MKDDTSKNAQMEKLAEAFKPEKKPRKKLIAIIVFAVGLVTMLVGVIFLILQLSGGPAVQDGEYLISAKEWVMEDDSNCEQDKENNSDCKSKVIWKFTEIGKGTLTSNNHLNDYDFAWALDDGELKIETDWLYTLENEYKYELNQNDGILTLKDGDDEYKFVGVFETE